MNEKEFGMTLSFDFEAIAQLAGETGLDPQFIYAEEINAAIAELRFQMEAWVDTETLQTESK